MTSQQQHYSRQKGVQGNQPSTALTTTKETIVLHDGKIDTSPIVALGCGGPGVILGLFSNGWQIYTTYLGFLDMLFIGSITSPGNNTRLTTNPLIHGTCILLAIAIQFGLLFFFLRVEREYKKQLHQDKNRVDALMGAAVVVAHQRDFFFYYGLICIFLEGVGDYAFVYSIGGNNLLFMIAYGAISMMTSTHIFAIASEWVWVGIQSWMKANAQIQKSTQGNGGGN